MSTERVAEYPAGHQNHLSPDQAGALEDFKVICQKNGCYSPPTDKTLASHDDETLLRFLRARKFVPNDAFQQWKKTEDWRKDEDIASWYNTINVDQFESTRVLYTHWTGRRDKRGIPLYMFKIGSIDGDKLKEYQTSDKQIDVSGKTSIKLRKLFATYEHLTNFVMPLCSSVPARPHRDVPVSQTCCIVDVSNVSLRQFWAWKGHLQDASTLATAHYPETLGRTFVVGAPFFFGAIWNWLQGWFDPGTVAKIFILSSSEVKSTLEKFIDVDSIPKSYGGGLDWDFGQTPNIDPEILDIMNMQKTAKSIPNGPIRWQKSEDGTMMEAHAVGTESGGLRDDVFAKVSVENFLGGLGKVD